MDWLESDAGLVLIIPHHYFKNSVLVDAFGARWHLKLICRKTIGSAIFYKKKCLLK
jgi:hypothetical protein